MTDAATAQNLPDWVIAAGFLIPTIGAAVGKYLANRGADRATRNAPLPPTAVAPIVLTSAPAGLTVDELWHAYQALTLKVDGLAGAVQDLNVYRDVFDITLPHLQGLLGTLSPFERATVRQAERLRAEQQERDSHE